MKNIENNVSANEFIQSLEDSIEDSLHVLALDSEIAAEKLLRHYESRKNPTEQANEYPIPIQGVILQGMERYDDLIGQTLEDMQGMFNAEEIRILLSATNAEVTRWSYGRSLASDVADDLGIESLDEVAEDTPLKSLLLKLLELDSTQTLALTDFCERYWRNPQSGDLDDVCESLGLKLRDGTPVEV